MRAACPAHFILLLSLCGVEGNYETPHCVLFLIRLYCSRGQSVSLATVIGTTQGNQRGGRGSSKEDILSEL
jgi:hypothetical protein